MCIWVCVVCGGLSVPCSLFHAPPEPRIVNLRPIPDSSSRQNPRRPAPPATFFHFSLFPLFPPFPPLPRRRHRTLNYTRGTLTPYNLFLPFLLFLLFSYTRTTISAHWFDTSRTSPLPSHSASSKWPRIIWTWMWIITTSRKVLLLQTQKYPYMT